MKLLTITVPCYNAQNNLERCLESLVRGGSDTEIIIVDNGSTDGSIEIAESYVKQYSEIIKLIHQDNEGYGAAINTGLAHATGIYFKVVDANDWLDVDGYKKVLSTLESLVGGNCALDMLITNVVYEKYDAKRQKVIRFNSVLPESQIFGWEATRRFNAGKYFHMNSVFYRTRLLRECHMVLPRNTLYVDNLYMYVPLPYVANMYYLNLDLYRYQVGGSAFFGSEDSMIENLDQQIKINKMMVDAYELRYISDFFLRNYMFNYLELVTSISTVMLMRSGMKEDQDKKRDLWMYISEKDRRLYMRLRNRTMGQSLHLPGKSGRNLSFSLYKFTHRLTDFR